MRKAVSKNGKATQKKVVFCIPTITKPYPETLAALEASVPLFDKAGWEHYIVSEIGCPYISAARSTMLRKALDAKADAIVFIDHDVSWKPQDLLTLVETPGDYVSGTYRFKHDEVEYMGRLFVGEHGKPIARESDSALKAFCVPAGFMKITRAMVNRFIEVYPHLCYGERCNPHVDLFNHGAHGNMWYGEDYACSRNWLNAGGEIWLVPDLDITHHAGDKSFPGNYHRYLLSLPGGKNDPSKKQRAKRRKT